MIWRCPIEPTRATVRAARADLHRHLERKGVPPPVLDGVLLVASELTTNAVLHGAPPIELAAGVGRQVVRVEVADGSTDLPRLRHYGAAAVTGRGLGIVDVVSDAWGAFERANGKTVWAEVAASGADAPRASSDIARSVVPGTVPAAHSGPRLRMQELQGWWDNSSTAGAVPIVYRGVPVDVYLELQEIADGLAREAQFAALSEGDPEPEDEPHAGLSELLAALRGALSHPPERMRAEVLAAKARGEPTVDLTVLAAPDGLQASTRHVELLERADDFARSGALLVGPASPAVARLRRWFVDELRRQMPRRQVT